MISTERREQAGDYVLGLLAGAERAAFEAAMTADAELRTHVDTLTSRFGALDATARPEPVPEHLWDRIETTLGAPTIAARPESRRTAPAWMAIAASVVLSVGAGFLAGRMTAPPVPQPVVVAVLMNDGSAPGAIIEAFADNRVHVVPLEDFVVPDGKVLEVWTKWDEETGPVSLGQIGSAAEVTLQGPNQPVPQTGQLYEITLEDAPRSSTGRPTGPILVKGFAAMPPA